MIPNEIGEELWSCMDKFDSDPLTPKNFLIPPWDSTEINNSLLDALYVTAYPTAVPPVTTCVTSFPEVNWGVPAVAPILIFWYDVWASITSFTKNSLLPFWMVLIPTAEDIKLTFLVKLLSSYNWKLFVSI